MPKKTRPHVLAAGTGQALELAQDALSRDVRLIRAQSAPETIARLHGVDLVLADVSFDRARMMRLFQALKDCPEARGLSVVCCATGKRPRRAAAFVNVRRLTREYGESVAGEILRQVVSSRLP